MTTRFPIRSEVLRWACERAGYELRDLAPRFPLLADWERGEKLPTFKQLEYRNLLGACQGGDGQPPQLQHCDTRKADTDLLWNPADPAHHIQTRLRYEPDGSIRSDDAAFSAELENVLNLNLPILKNNRKSVLDAVLDWWQRERTRIRGAVPRATFERERGRRIGGAGDLEPFCQVAVWWLEQRLARMAA